MVVKLFCAVAGVGRAFSVNVDISETIDDLKKKIKEKKPTLVPFVADLLKMYLAREGTTWLNSSDDALQALNQQEIPDRIKSLMVKERLLNATAPLDRDDYFGSDFKPKSEEIHVLVELRVKS